MCTVFGRLSLCRNCNYLNVWLRRITSKCHNCIYAHCSSTKKPCESWNKWVLWDNCTENKLNQTLLLSSSAKVHIQLQMIFISHYFVVSPSSFACRSFYEIFYENLVLDFVLFSTCVFVCVFSQNIFRCCPLNNCSFKCCANMRMSDFNDTEST